MTTASEGLPSWNGTDLADTEALTRLANELFAALPGDHPKLGGALDAASREFARQGGVAGLAPDSLGNGGLPLSLDSLAVPGASAASGLRVPEPALNQGLDGQALLTVNGADELADVAREIGALWLRDEITGQRVVGISGNSSPGAWFTLGADFGHVWSSAYLPEDEIELSDTRTRVRAGVNMRHGDFGVFYGVTWLSKEFEAQPEGQVLGTLRVRANF